MGCFTNHLWVDLRANFPNVCFFIKANSCRLSINAIIHKLTRRGFLGATTKAMPHSHTQKIVLRLLGFRGRTSEMTSQQLTH